MTFRAFEHAHVIFDFSSYVVRVCFQISSFQIRNHAFKPRLIFSFKSSVSIEGFHFDAIFFIACPVENFFQIFFIHFRNRHVYRELMFCGYRLENPVVPTQMRCCCRPRYYRSFAYRKRFVWNYEVRVDFQFRTESVTLFACAVRTVERKISRLDFRQAYSAIRTCEFFGKYLPLFCFMILNYNRSIAMFERRFYRVGKSRSVRIRQVYFLSGRQLLDHFSEIFNDQSVYDYIE
ncbi:MAG: hypothetical protein ACD_65C00189G0001 [uncultured bacterium]|nr:MAG: hypothetical protein ACD_65C00189G0001 [uncultured bacterium]